MPRFIKECVSSKVLCAGLVLCGCICIGFWGSELSCWVMPLWVGDTWQLWLETCVWCLCAGWCWPWSVCMYGAHVRACGGGKFMELALELVEGLELFHCGAPLVCWLIWTMGNFFFGPCLWKGSVYEPGFLDPSPEWRGPPLGTRGWSFLWGIITWTWEYNFCMVSIFDLCLHWVLGVRAWV